MRSCNLAMICGAILFFRARFYAAEIASAIGYLHSLGIIYRFVRSDMIQTMMAYKSLFLQFNVKKIMNINNYFWNVYCSVTNQR